MLNVSNFSYSTRHPAYPKIDDTDKTDEILDETDIPAEQLLEAIEPSIRESHTVINHGVININIGNNKEKDGIKYDRRTKDYIWSTVIDKQLQVKLLSVGRFDATSGSGTAFDYEERRPVSFQLDKDADERTVESIFWSHREYGRRRLLKHQTESAIAMQFTALKAVDGRSKKLFVKKARREVGDL